jgi:hypothetical protein
MHPIVSRKVYKIYIKMKINKKLGINIIIK